MLKNILKLEGAQELSKKEQKNIKGSEKAMALNCYCLDSGIKVGVVSTHEECVLLRMQYCYS